MNTPPPTTPMPAGPGDVGTFNGFVYTTGTVPGAGCGPESWTAPGDGAAQIQFRSNLSYQGPINLDPFTGASTSQNVSAAVGTASLQLTGQVPTACAPTVACAPQQGLNCPSLSGSYVRQSPTLTVTVSGDCYLFTEDAFGNFANYHVILTLVLTGATAPPGDTQVPGSVPSPFAGTLVETNFYDP